MKALDQAAKANSWTDDEKARVQEAVKASPKDSDELGVDDIERMAHAIGVFVRFGRRFYGAIRRLWPF